MYNFSRIFLYASVFMSIFYFDWFFNNTVEYISSIIFGDIFKPEVNSEGKINADWRVFPSGLSVLASEMAAIVTTIIFLKRYIRQREEDKLDFLLQESKEALRETNEFLEKWRLNQKNCKKLSEYSYLDDDVNTIKMKKLEVPILQMAIIDSQGTSRRQQERGDAGEMINISDATLLPMESVLGEDYETPTDLQIHPFDSDEFDEKEFRSKNRYLWDVIEEDTNNIVA